MQQWYRYKGSPKKGGVNFMFGEKWGLFTAGENFVKNLISEISFEEFIYLTDLCVAPSMCQALSESLGYISGHRFLPS